MRIAISCNSFGAGGGLERYALDITRALAARVHEPIVVYARSFESGQIDRERIEPRRIDVSGVPRALRDHVFSARLGRLRRSAPVDEVLIGCNRVRGSDVAICGGTHRGYLKAGRRGAWPGDRWRIRLEADQYAGAAIVVAHSRQMHAELQALYGVPADRITLLYPPVDTHRFTLVRSGERQALRAKYGFGDEVVFLFPSSDHRRKGLNVLAPHFSRLQGRATLAVAGRPARGVGSHIRSLGYCRDIEDVYRAADFTILASEYEPFGLVGIESILCGTPLVFADDIACLEVTGSEAVERFSRTSAQSVQAAIDRAVARAGSAQARVDEPRSVLAYDPDPAVHADALLQICMRLAEAKRV